jgi:hypothetical protein
LFHEVQILVNECETIDTLLTLKQHMKSAIALLQASKVIGDSSSKHPISSVASNAMHKKQLTFYSTRQQSKQACRLTKPTLEEENESLKKIQNKLKCVQCAGWKKIVP